MINEPTFNDYALDVINDAEIEQTFDDRVWVSVDRHLWDAFVNSVPAYDSISGGSWSEHIEQLSKEGN